MDKQPSLSEVLSSFQSPQHLVLEALLVIFIVYLLVQKRYKPKKTSKLSKEEEDALIAEWQPAPLPQELNDLQKLNAKIPIVSGAPTNYLTVNGKRALNFGTTNFLGNTSTEGPLQAVQKYGCGSCGPRGFYGTIDIHLQLEEKLAKFMGTEEAIIYSSGFAATSSAIPAFAKRGDILIVDKGVNYVMKTGMLLSRSTVRWFEHNNMEDLENVLKSIHQEHTDSKSKLTRRFLIIEGLYLNYGDIVPLPKVMQLKEKYRFRIILEDSNALGVLGKTGRGTPEHFNIPNTSIELILSSMGNSLASSGGFCVGTSLVVAHQRLNSSGYVFSASLPPYLAAGAMQGLDLIDQHPELLEKLRANIQRFRKTFGVVKGVVLQGDILSPITHIRLTDPCPSYQEGNDASRMEQEVLLQKIVELCLEKNVALSRSKYVHDEEFMPSPSIPVIVTASHTDENIIEGASVIRDAIQHVLKPYL